jgi:hypothetical protein
LNECLALVSRSETSVSVGGGRVAIIPVEYCLWCGIGPGDRRVRVRAPGIVTCSAYAVRSTIGPVALVGTNEGEVDVYELLSGRSVLRPPFTAV